MRRIFDGSQVIVLDDVEASELKFRRQHSGLRTGGSVEDEMLVGFEHEAIFMALMFDQFLVVQAVLEEGCEDLVVGSELRRRLGYQHAGS
jgi:hypothetical protein